MTEDTLSKISGWLYPPSILVFLFIIFCAYFLPVWLPSTKGKRRFFFWVATTLTTLFTFMATLTWAFSISGCFESCSGKTDDEIGTIWAAIVNWLYIVIIFSLCISFKGKSLTVD